MLIPVMRSRQNDATLVPDDLLRIKKSDAKQSVQNLARVQTSMPDVADPNARHEREGLGPIRPRVAGDGCFGVARGALLHVTGLGGAAAIQAGAIPPLRI